MKTIFYVSIVLIALSFNACKSIEKLVDQGKYDEAIVLATKKLAGKKNKKTKHIKALEEAFAKVNKHDLNHIEFLKSQNDASAWDHIYNYVLNIQARQERVIPFLPIISKEGYAGHFELINTRAMLMDASKNAANAHFKIARTQLDNAKTSDNKLAAQEAHYHFRSVKSYVPTFKDIDANIDVSHTLGVFHILLKWDEQFINYNNFYTPDELYNMNSKWKEFHLDHQDEISFDYISSLFIDNIDISPERERINNFTETKEIEKWVDAKDQDGNIVKDSLGQVIQVKKVKTIMAYITEFLRTKDATIEGHFELKDFNTGEIIIEDHFRHDINFTTDACSFTGNRRALKEGTRKRIDHTLLPFPSDYDMIREGLVKMNQKFMYHNDEFKIGRQYQEDMATTF